MIVKTLSHYRVVEKLGEGGMGVVYRALDTHLDRPVALKLLPAEKMADPERKKRFIQEAKAASALNHPNIITIHDINTDNGVDFIAMEFVYGKTLGQLLVRKGVRLTEVLKYGIQIADALSKAHAAGIVHRDLKPANIMVTEEGLVKVLDFGLAKLVEPSESNKSAETLATKWDQAPSTEAGAIVGTVAYMSPEQAEGKRIDSRSDIFSFGSVLYEMVTGQRAFQRDSKISTLSAILQEDPRPVSEVVDGLPKELERVIIRCLRKDPERRWQSMADVKVALMDIKEESDSGSSLSGAGQAVTPRRVNPWIWAVVLAALVLLIGGAVWWRLTSPQTESSMHPPKIIPFTSSPGWEQDPAFSSDGNQVAFAWDGEKGDNFDIYVKLIDGGTPLRLTTNPAPEFLPTWSPDGRRIAFLRFLEENEAGIFVIPALGGPERKLGQSRFGFGSLSTLSWSADGKLLAIADRSTPQDPQSLFLLSTETGERRRLTSPPLDSMDELPVFSPDAQTLAFTRRRNLFVSDIYLLFQAGGMPKGEPRRLTFDERDISGLDWTPDGHELVFSSNRGGSQSLWRIAVSGGDPQRLAAGGENGYRLSVARQGHRLVYQQAAFDQNIWRIAGPTMKSGSSPAEEKPTKLISSTKGEYDPQFSPDGRKIVFASDRSGDSEIWVCDSEGSSPVQVTALGGSGAGSPRWSSDGRQIAFDSTKEGSSDIYVISADGGLPRRLTAESSSKVRPSWSRDGRWVYFGSNRTGDWQVWKAPSEGGPAVQVTKKGGREAFESPDGRLLFYTKQSPIQGIWSIPVSGGEEIQVLDHGMMSYWSVAKIGIFLMNLQKKAGPTLEFFSFATRRLTEIRTLPKDLRFGGNTTLAVSWDGRWILCVSTDRAESDLVLVENFR